MDLTPFNTFGISASCDRLEVISVNDDFNKIITAANKGETFLILGGGSNVLFADKFQGTVFLVRTKGVEVIKEDSKHILLSVAAGEDWHQFVSTCLSNKYFGLENLALIPGTVGAAPIQNIGAYGVEVKQRIESVEAIDLTSGRCREFTSEECSFSYRDSLFKQQMGHWCITRVCFKLDKKYVPVLSYEPLKGLYAGNDSQVTAKEVFEKVIETRRSKLPDPAELGNAGSFFKNPVIEKTHYRNLLKQNSEIPSYYVDEKLVKLPAGWLIDKLGFKGHSFRGAAVHTQQALVLVNQNNATGSDVLALAQEIEHAVLETFNIQLEREVRVIQ